MWDIMIQGEKKPLGEVHLEDVPDDVPCIIFKDNFTSFRVIKVPSVKRLIVWDLNNKDRTSSYLLPEEKRTFEEMVVDALEFWENVGGSRHSMVD